MSFIVRTGFAGSLVIMSNVAFWLLGRFGALSVIVISADPPAGMVIGLAVALNIGTLVDRLLIINGDLPVFVNCIVWVQDMFFWILPMPTESVGITQTGAFFSCFADNLEKSS